MTKEQIIEYLENALKHCEEVHHCDDYMQNMAFQFGAFEASMQYLLEKLKKEGLKDE